MHVNSEGSNVSLCRRTHKITKGFVDKQVRLNSTRLITIHDNTRHEVQDQKYAKYAQNINTPDIVW